MQADLAGKIAIVTGSTSGIGLAIASALVAAGCRIVLNGRRPSEAGEALLTESGAHGLFVAADLGRKECPASPWRAYLPWLVRHAVLFASAVWLMAQPMEMRGTFLGG